MSSSFQTIAALAIVALALTGLIVRAIVKRRKPGCGGDCACPSPVINPRKPKVWRRQS